MTEIDIARQIIAENAARTRYGRAHRLANYLRYLRGLGYQDHHNSDDSAIARETACRDCGKHGVEYIGLKGPEYVAIAVCPVCNDWYEF